MAKEKKKDKNKEFQREIRKMHVADFFERILGLLFIAIILAALYYTTTEMIKCALYN